MVDRFAQVEIQNDPYPHLHLTEVLPEDVYWRLLELYPAAECFEPMDERHAGDNGETNRGVICLAKDPIDGLSAEQSELYLGVQQALRSPELKRAVYDAFREGLAYRYGVAPEEAGELPGFAQPLLLRETKGYTIPPHPDTRKKVVTFQIAMPSDDSQLDLGTTIYQRSLRPADLATRPRGFCTVGQYPFAPNTAFAFVVLNTIRRKSWHGREQLGEFAGVRKTILNVFYEKPQLVA